MQKAYSIQGNEGACTDRAHEARTLLMQYMKLTSWEQIIRAAVRVLPIPGLQPGLRLVGSPKCGWTNGTGSK